MANDVYADVFIAFAKHDCFFPVAVAKLLIETRRQVVGHLLVRADSHFANNFAGELDNASRNFVGHTQNQMEEVVRDAFERAWDRHVKRRRRKCSIGSFS